VSSFPFLPRTISLVGRHSGIYQGTGRCRCSHSTGAITADTVQIERSGCSGTSADSEHLYSITHTTPTTTCSGPTTGGSTPPSDTGVRRNSPNRDSSSKKPSNTPLPIHGSYKSELTKTPANLVDRDFHAERPNMPWVTDLTEFSIPAGKAYLSPVIDCHDGMPAACTIGTSLDSALADGMLPDACSTLKDGEKPIIHSDRGRHYRWPEWIRIRKDNNLTRSTGAKGCSPDNAAAEGFLGRIKQEFFHKRSFAGVTMDEFVDMLDDHMVWYRDRRIKTESGRGHHGPVARTRSCGMIGGEGINDESNKTSPAPSRNTDLTLIMVVPVSYRR
jgi:transposase InsO family protein